MTSMRGDFTSWVAQGLSLVELVVAIAVGAVLSVPVGMILAEHLRGGIRARDQVVATQLARYEMERLDALNTYASLASGGPYSLSGVPAFTITTTVTCETGGSTCNAGGANSVKRVQVDVRKLGETNLYASLVTFRTENVQFGD